MSVVLINETSSRADLKRELGIIKQRLPVVDSDDRIIWIDKCPRHIAPSLVDLPNWTVMESREYAIRLFRNAGAWAKLVNSLQQTVLKNAAEDPSIVWPYFALQAFAVELYFKCLLTAEGKFSRGHDLFALYSLLSDGAKANLVMLVRTQTGNPGFDVERCIHEVASAFPTLRYIHETLKAPPGMNIGVLATCLNAGCATALNVPNDTPINWASLTRHACPGNVITP